jgi:hypothetical protein
VAGIFFGMDTVPSTQADTLSKLIQTETSTPSQESTTYIAKATAAQTAAFVAPSPAPQEESVIAADETATPSATPQQETTQIVEEQEGKINIVKYEGPEQANLYAEAFETPEDKAKRRKIELVVSGNASDGPQEQLIFNRPMYVQSATAPTKTGITETGPSDYSIPVTLGAGVKFSLTEKWALGAGLSYTIAGREFAGIYTKIKSGSEPFRESFSKIRNTQNYIGLNINAYYSFININWLDFYAYGGFGADKCISNHFQMFDKTNKYTYKDNTKQVLSALDKAKRRGLKAIGMTAEGYAKENTPVDTGLLRNSLAFALDGENPSISSYRSNNGEAEGKYDGKAPKESDDAVFVGTNVEYAPFNELGSRNNTAHHMLQRAATEHTEEYRALMTDSMKNA